MMKQYKYREFISILKKNGYTLNRTKGDHSIYTNDNGRHISVPYKLVDVIARRLIKENNLIIN